MGLLQDIGKAATLGLAPGIGAATGIGAGLADKGLNPKQNESIETQRPDYVGPTSMLNRDNPGLEGVYKLQGPQAIDLSKFGGTAGVGGAAGTGLIGEAQQIGQAVPSAGIEAFRKRATGTGLTATGDAQLEQQRIGERDAREASIRQSGQAGLQARTGAAMRGGLSGGARERMAENQQRSLFGGLSDVAREGTRQRAGIEAGSAEERAGFLQQLPEAESETLRPRLAAANIWGNVAASQLSGAKQQQELEQRTAEQNQQTLINERARLDKAAQDKYQMDTQEYFASKIAQAEKEKGESGLFGSGGFLGMGI